MFVPLASWARRVAAPCYPVGFLALLVLLMSSVLPACGGGGGDPFLPMRPPGDAAEEEDDPVVGEDDVDVSEPVEDEAEEGGEPAAPEAPERTVGVVFASTDAAPGYTLFAPMSSRRTWLVDAEGRVVHSWSSAYPPGLSVYLLDDGSILRTASDAFRQFEFAGIGGRVQRIAWDGTLLWDYTFSSWEVLSHHDIEPLPNGNVLILAWEAIHAEEALAAGRDPSLLWAGELWPDKIVEVRPDGLHGGTVVWEWRAWDHLVQDFDASRDNFGVVADHPERIDVNCAAHGAPDWLHTNSVDYNASLDQILLSVRALGEIWIIDHSTTPVEAAGRSGGRYGRGGDLLYRWGNPRNYGRGAVSDRQLWGQHDARWVGDGAADILVFNNGVGRSPRLEYSSVDLLTPPAGADGRYAGGAGTPYGPAWPTWTWTAPEPTEFYADVISGAHRTGAGTTLICDGPRGRIFEIENETGALVWAYVNPDEGDRFLGFTDELPAPPRGNRVFRATRIPPDHPGLVGRDLEPGETLETGD